MQTFRVDLGRESHPVHVGIGILDDIGRLTAEAGIAAGRVAIVTDSNVEHLYAVRVVKALMSFGFQGELISVPAGEASKSPAVLEAVYDRIISAEIDRTGAIFAVGGGVVGDLAGYAAATYLRGIAIVHIPTTVVAQVDSSLGGKTGINHSRAKNLIGAFHQPRAIVADVGTLASLPDREFREGLAEVIKYGAIMEAPMIADLERDLDRILAREAAILEAVVARSLRHKAAIVAADEHEGGLRKILNFGHTVGHALETSMGYGSLLHGEAVAIGMVAAARLSEKFGGLSADESSRLLRLIERAGLPTELPGSAASSEFMSALRLDKKRSRDTIEFVILEQLGRATTKRIDFEQIRSAVAS
jgi:3-dehydroquinate synthase